jgi:hypothetical protein
MHFLLATGRAHYAPAREGPKATSSRKPGPSMLALATAAFARSRHGPATRWQSHERCGAVHHVRLAVCPYVRAPAPRAARSPAPNCTWAASLWTSRAGGQPRLASFWPRPRPGERSAHLARCYGRRRSAAVLLARRGLDDRRQRWPPLDLVRAIRASLAKLGCRFPRKLQQGVLPRLTCGFADP